MSCQLNNEKVWSIKEKTTKSSITFRRNKPNFQDAQMNVNIYYIKDYQILSRWPDIKTNPIQTQSKPIYQRVKLMQSVYLQTIMNKNSAKGYKKTKPKQTQFLKRPKMNANAFPQKDYENETSHRPKKTNPNKPNFKRGRLLIGPMLPLYKPGNVQYYSRHNFKVKFPKISIISILRPAKLTKYRWKIMLAAAIFNPIKKLTITRTGANLKDRRII